MCTVLIFISLIICEALTQQTIAPPTPVPLPTSTRAPETPMVSTTTAQPSATPMLPTTTAQPSATPMVSTTTPMTALPTTAAPTTTKNAFYVLLVPNTTETQFFARLVAVLNTTIASVSVLARGTVNVSQVILFVEFTNAPLMVTLAFVNFTFTGSNAAALAKRCDNLDVESVLIPIGVAYGVSYYADLPVPTRSPSMPLFSCRLLSITVDTFCTNLAFLLSVTVDTVLVVSVGWETYDNNSTNMTAARSFVNLAIINATRVNFTFVGNLSSQAVASLLLASPAVLATIGITDLKISIPGATPVPPPLGNGSDPNSTPLLLIIGLSIGGAIVVIVLVALFCITSRKRRTGNSSELGGVKDRFGKSGARELALVLPTLDADNPNNNTNGYSDAAHRASPATSSYVQPSYGSSSVPRAPRTKLSADIALNSDEDDVSPLQHLERGSKPTAVVNKNFEESSERTEVRGKGFVAFGGGAPQPNKSKGVDDDDYMDLL